MCLLNWDSHQVGELMQSLTHHAHVLGDVTGQLSAVSCLNQKGAPKKGAPTYTDMEGAKY